MPKVLVLFHSRTGNTAAQAERVAEGARSVRFTEVDVRRLEDLTPEATIAADPAWAASHAQLRQRYRALDDVATVADYDALVIGAASPDGAPSDALTHFLDRLAPLAASGALADRVGAVFTPDDQDGARRAMLVPLASLGLILVPPAADAPDAYAHGARVATVAEWVRHAKSHAAGHHHHHH
jgi:NAD(P)H dehydrogenase (quinone)